FLFATEDGTISGWSPRVNLTHAILAVDRSGAHAIYKGLAIAGNSHEERLYATDFHNGTVDVFNPRFEPIRVEGRFADPDLPAGYAPFGIRNILGDLYVTYAKQDEKAEDDVKGPGFGFVNVFDPEGRKLRRFASTGPLNAPWGLALAPTDFGAFSNSLL